MQKAFPEGGGVALTPDRMPHHHTLGTFNITIEGVDGGPHGYKRLHLSAVPFSIIEAHRNPGLLSCWPPTGRLIKAKRDHDVSMCVKEPLRARKRAVGASQKGSEIIAQIK